MRKYSEYKDSGVQWMGEVPKHWSHPRVKSVCSMKSGDNITSLEIRDEGDFPVYGANGFRGYYNQYNKEGDYLLVGRQGALAGNVHHVIGKFWATDHALVTTIRQGDIQFLFYALTAMNLNQYAFETAAQPGLAASKILSFSLPFPPLSEQQHIVSFLDKKTSQIDEYIATKEKEIEALKEWKKALTAKLITQGLQADAEMKETGVFWWPHTPKHWRIVNMGRVLNKMSREKEDGAELLVCTNKGTVTKRGDSKTGLVADSDDIYQGVKAGDLLIHGMDTWHGAIAVSNYDGMCTPVVHVCTSKENLHFVSYYMQVMAYSKIFKLISNGVRQNTSDFRSWDKVKKIPIMLPTREEQDAIVGTIIKATTKADKMIVELTYHVEYMKEYKQRLIADVVTGKINVQP